MLEDTTDIENECKCECINACEECLTTVFEDGKMPKILCDCNLIGECICFGYVS